MTAAYAASWWRVYPERDAAPLPLPSYLARAWRRVGRAVVKSTWAEADALCRRPIVSTGVKRPHADALHDAEEFKALFPAECYEHWTFAGSLRRGQPEVTDVEHVVIPRFGRTEDSDLFGEPVNLLWHHLDALTRTPLITRHIYGDTGFRWGPRYRGVDFRGFNHELFAVDKVNYGYRLALLTGPAAHSKSLVEAVNARGRYRLEKGYIWTRDGGRVHVPDERAFYAIAGLPFIEPEGRR